MIPIVETSHLVNRSSFRKRKKRVAAACDFCRRRKLGCDNAAPRCGSCQSHQKQCTYAYRPSNSRIKQLEEENARLRGSSRASELQNAEVPPNTESVERILTLVHSSPMPHHTEHGAVEEILDLPDEPVTAAPVQHVLRHPSPTVTRRYTSGPDRENRFHGPSSAMFDGPRSSHKPVGDSDTPDDVYKKCQLLAEATRQRQMEMINSKSGKLDFDGVEPEMAMNMLTIFWNRQHHSGSIVYRPAFMRDMACNGPLFSKLLLNAIYFSASEYLSRAAASGLEGIMATRCEVADNCTTGLEFRRRIDDMLHDPETRLLFKSEVTTIQALIIVSDALFSWCDEKSASWHYSGIAIGMITDLGLHSESVNLSVTSNRSLENIETHRRLFWAAFAMDKLQSIYQGRPSRLREPDNNVPIRFLDEFDELEPFHTIGYAAKPTFLGSPGYSVSTFEQLCKLSLIMDRVLCNLYTERSSQRNPEDLVHIASCLDEDLKTWRGSLPQHISVLLEDLTSAPILPHLISLLALYNATIILLHRPFVSDGHLQSADQSRVSQSFAVCAAAASDVNGLLQAFRPNFCVKATPYAMSYAIYVSATIHLRIAAQRRPGSEAHRSLRNCLDALFEHQMMSYASRRCLSILKGLMKRLKVDVSDSTGSASSHSFEPGAVSTGASAAPSEIPTPLAPNNPQGIIVADGSYSADIQTGMVTPWSGIDIAEIVKTFNLSPPSAVYDDSGLVDGQADDCIDRTFQDLDTFTSFDALFGLDIH
ncbi:fungal specific transcription factor domain-containing protein [Trichoderma breve]|uniref:Fungal specific transcription factor domain-containing protein n=1 Tax=Trichoderma breve TaxID=2034170 RepID=A0A9W9B5G8_9HYPO|nr:fungal specific transcription factor domain-containing protein [Trichoderma breve]KAJ4856808.1 fungal specific transcription factor domain-containing protein [Trichoderma breve]